jgi:hypothetical protein
VIHAKKLVSYLLIFTWLCFVGNESKQMMCRRQREQQLIFFLHSVSFYFFKNASDECDLFSKKKKKIKKEMK